MIDKKRLKWTKEDDKAVRQFKRDVKDGKIKTMPFDEAVFYLEYIRPKIKELLEKIEK